MIKELKYLFFLIVIFFFLFFSLRYYFSDQNNKNLYRSLSNVDKRIENTKNNLTFLENNTDNIIEFVEYKNSKKTKKYSFWKLLYND